MKYNIVDTLNYILNLKVVPFELLQFLKRIKAVMSIPSLDNNKLFVDIEQQKIYYRNDFQEEIELEFKTNIDGGYQILANVNIIYEENSLIDGDNTTTEGKSNSLIRAKTFGNIPGTSTDSHIHGEIQQPKSAAFARISILVFISILISLAIASLILLFK